MAAAAGLGTIANAPIRAMEIRAANQRPAAGIMGLCGENALS